MAKYIVGIDAEVYAETDEDANEQAKDLAARLTRPEGEAFVVGVFDIGADQDVADKALRN